MFEICDSGFCHCSSLRILEVPGSVERIGCKCFVDCRSLQNISFASGSCLSSVGPFAFFGCVSLLNLVFPGTATVPWGNCLKNRTFLESVKFESGCQLSKRHRLLACLGNNVEIIFDK